MKKSLALLVGAVVPSILLLGACGDDVVDADALRDDDASAQQDATSIPPPRDGSSDARNDGDAARDASTDARSDADGEVPDSSDDGGDAGDADGGDGGGPDPAIKTFVDALGAAACAKYEGCCDGLTPAPAPGLNTCTAAIQSDPKFFGALLDPYYFSPNVGSGDRVRIDTALAASCLAKVDAMGCMNEGFPASEWKAILQDCSQALFGVGVAGDECYSDLECTKDFACNGATRGGAPGTCTAFRGEGEVYSGSAQYDGDSCSYRGFGFGTGRRALYDSAASAQAGIYKCLPQQQTLGAACVPFSDPAAFEGRDKDCASYACGFNDTFDQAVCVDVKSDLFYCDQYVSEVP